jgi:hypothetical protein
MTAVTSRHFRWNVTPSRDRRKNIVKTENHSTFPLLFTATLSVFWWQKRETTQAVGKNTIKYFISGKLKLIQFNPNLKSENKPT